MHKLQPLWQFTCCRVNKEEIATTSLLCISAVSKTDTFCIKNELIRIAAPLHNCK